jgi:hypothetical protein
MTDEPDAITEAHLTDEDLRKGLVARSRGTEMHREVHFLRGAYLAEAASIESILAQVLTMHFLRTESHDVAQVGLRQWHRWILGSMTFMNKLEAVEGLCRDEFQTAALQRSGFADLLPKVRAANSRRNELAHSSTSVDYHVTGGDEFVKVGVFTTQTKHRKGLLREEVQLEVLRQEVSDIQDLAADLSQRHWDALLAEDSDIGGVRGAQGESRDLEQD